MSKLLSLLRATMSEGMQIFNYRGKTEKSRRIMPLILGSLVGIMMLFSATAMTTELKMDGVEATILSLYTVITSIIIVMEGIYKSGDLLFKPRDNEMLMAMPIKKSTIVAARIIKFYVFELLYCLIFLLPAIIAYALNSEVGISYYLVSLTMLLLVPVIPIAVSCIIGLLISGVAARFKRRTFLQVILSFASLFAFAIIILLINTASGQSGQIMTAINNKVTELYYPASAFVELTTSFNLGSYLLFIGINLAVAATTVSIISHFYFRIVTRLGTIKKAGNADTNYKFTKRSQISAMVHKEIVKYFNTPVLLMNTAIGLVLFLTMMGVLCVKYDDIVNSVMSSVENFPLTVDEVHSFLPSIAFLLIAFASLMTFITATMISLEGKVFNLLKTMPISGVKIIMSKVLAAMLLIAPITVLGGILMAIRFQFGLLDGLLVLISAIAMPLVTELIGILIDLKYARFDGETDAVVVKQSAGVMVATFLGLGMLLITTSLAFAIIFLAGQTAGLAMIDAIFVIVALFLYFVIVMRGEEKIRKLSI